jgi:hypothetical protein
MATFYVSRDYGDGSGDLSGKGTQFNGDQNDDQQINWDMQNNSRIGATVKAENIGGRFEFGMDDDANNVSLRRMYGTWDFGAATLKLGKDYSPTSQFISGQVFDGDLGLLGIGTGYSSRNDQVSLSFGGFEVALIDTGSAGIIRGMTTGDVDEFLPKIEAGWGMSFDTWNFNLNGGYQMYEVEGAGAADEDVDVISYTIGADAGVNFGPAYVKGAISYGTNWADAGWHISTYGATYDGDDDTDDVDSIMGALVAGFKFHDGLTFEAGFGYRKDDSDARGEDDAEQYSYYLQAVISLHPGVWVIPEVGYYDYDDNIGDQLDGDQLYLGAKWQIDF